jgi:hypothetical protein
MYTCTLKAMALKMFLFFVSKLFGTIRLHVWEDFCRRMFRQDWRKH